MTLGAVLRIDGRGGKSGVSVISEETVVIQVRGDGSSLPGLVVVEVVAANDSILDAFHFTGNFKHTNVEKNRVNLCVIISQIQQ